MPDQTYDLRELGALVRAKRGARSLRATAKEIGDVSPSTLLRVEQGRLPDLDTFTRLCSWLGISTDRFKTSPNGPQVLGPTSREPSRADVIIAHLKADRTLAPETVEALATMIRLAYEAAERGEFGKRDQT